jgi:hypothetical protein
MTSGVEPPSRSQKGKWIASVPICPHTRQLTELKLQRDTFTNWWARCRPELRIARRHKRSLPQQLRRCGSDARIGFMAQRSSQQSKLCRQHPQR